LPLISELIYNLAEKCLFSKFDIWWGYNNIRIKEGDKYKAAFKTSEGLFEPTVMFFGLTNSPATFQMIMDDIFQDEIAQGWLCIYMDDMIIATEDDEVLHELRVNHILDKLEKFDLFLKPESVNSTNEKSNTLEYSLEMELSKWTLLKFKALPTGQHL